MGAIVRILRRKCENTGKKKITTEFLPSLNTMLISQVRQHCFTGGRVVKIGIAHCKIETHGTYMRM